MIKRVGFMGMGIMGQAMARNLLKAGFAVTVYNRDKAKCEPLRQAGAQVADTAAECAASADACIAMVTGPDALQALLSGPDGVGRQLEGGRIFVNMSTVPPAFARRLGEQVRDLGGRFADAPASGSKKPAEEGTLVILAGGDPQTLDELEPVFAALGKKTVRCGDVGQGSMMKMAVNLLLAAMTEALGEAVLFGEKGGLEAGQILDVILSGPMGCGLFQLKDDMLRQGEYPAQFPLKHMLKDLKFVTDTAFETGAPAPSAHLNLQLYRQALSRGLGDADFAAVKKLLEGLG